LGRLDLSVRSGYGLFGHQEHSFLVSESVHLEKGREQNKNFHSFSFNPQKEDCMVAFNPFIEKQLPVIQEFFDAMSVEPPDGKPSETHIPARIVMRSIDNLYKHVLVQRKTLHASNPKVFKSLGPIMRAIGIPEKLKRLLAQQAKIHAELAKKKTEKSKKVVQSI